MAHCLLRSGMLQEVGMPADYVNKLARMFQDIKVSEDLNQVFKEVHKHNKLALPGDLQAQFFYIYMCIYTTFDRFVVSKIFHQRIMEKMYYGFLK